MLGDANGSYATFAANGTVKANEADYILVDLNNVIVEGTKVSVPVSIVSEETVNAFDLALGVNENTLTFVSMEDAQLGSSKIACEICLPTLRASMSKPITKSMSLGLYPPMSSYVTPFNKPSPVFARATPCTRDEAQLPTPTMATRIDIFLLFVI
jgi:hypothetical protein